MADKKSRPISEKQIQLLIAQIDDAAIIGLDCSGKINFWNAGAHRYFGRSEHDAVGRHVACLYAPQDVASGKPTSDLERARLHGMLREEFAQMREDGTEFSAQVSLAPLIDRDNVFVGYSFVVRETTISKRYETVLKRMVALSLNAIVKVNAQGLIVFVNDQTERMFRYSRDQLIGQLVEMLIPERYRASHPKHRDGFFAAPVARPMGSGRELYALRSDGSEFPVEISLSPFQAVVGPAALASIVDITERKRAEEKFRLVFESAPHAMVMINQEGLIVLANLQAEQLFGYTRAELLGNAIEILVPDRYATQHPIFRRAFFDSPSVRSMGAGRELRARRKDGSEFPVEIGLTPLESQGEMLVLSAIVDISARKAAEERTRKYLADLAHVARLSTVGQMFSELAHEINQPLAAAANYGRACITFARSKPGIAISDLIEWMERSVVQSTRAIDIVKRLGSFVKKDGGKRTVFNINRVMEQVVSLAAPTVQTAAIGSEPIQFQLQLDESVPEVSADIVQIEQVLLNLVRNAVDAMQDSTLKQRVLTLSSRFDESWVYVSVRDTGTGIDPINMTKLFGPYFTTKTNGMGLGLSISRSIVEDHDGTIEVESSSDGTEFRFSLPMLKAGLNR